MQSHNALRLTSTFLVWAVAATISASTFGAVEAKKVASDASAGEATSTEDDASNSAGASAADTSDADTTNADNRDTDDESVVTNDPAKKTVPARDSTYSHRGQFNVRLALGGSYRIVMRYDDSPLCSQKTNDQGEELTLCGFAAPLTLDAAIGYAPIAGVEPFLWGRFGLAHEAASNTAPLVILGAGARLYTMSDSAFKFFVEPAIGLELEKGANDVVNQRFRYKQDVIVRLAIGPHIDFARNFGAYASAGLTVGMLRSLQSWMDLHVGVQARFP